MKIKYFQDTNTLYIEFRPAEVAETKDLDENTLLDVDRDGISAALPLSTRANGLKFRNFPTSRSRPDSLALVHRSLTRRAPSITILFAVSLTARVSAFT